MGDEESNAVNINMNLQKENNYMVIMKGDSKFNSKDVLFYIKTFEIPGMTVSPTEVDFLPQRVKYPAQGKMDYEPLNLSLLIDDNLNSWIELAGWANRLKNPGRLLQSHNAQFDPHNYNRVKTPIKTILESSNQYPIEYKDIDVIITDRNHQSILKFTFINSWITNLSGLKLNAQGSEYLECQSTYFFDYYILTDMITNEQIFPILDTVLLEK